MPAMLLKGLLTLASISILGLAIIGYHKLPEGLEDPYAVQIFMGFIKILRTVGVLREMLGFGDKLSGIKGIIGVLKVEVPVSASYGNLKVTRDVISGVPVIIYQPLVSQKLYPGIVFFHGGGWTTGSADVYDELVYNYANETGTVIISVDYRLAPEHPFPAPIQDCLDVTRFILRHGAQYNVDVTKVGVAGDSAGGNLAAAVAWKLSKEKSDLHPLLFQILHYPAMQAFDMLLPSYTDLNNNLPLLTQERMSMFYALYMGIDMENIDFFTSVISENRHIPPHLRKSKYAEFVDVKLLPEQYQTQSSPVQAASTNYDGSVYAKIKDVITNPLFSPLMSPDLAGLPPAFIHICEFDVLRDDGFLYARRLKDAGVKVDVHFSKGGFHGDMVIGTIYFHSTPGQRALSAVYAFIHRILAH